MRHWIFWVALLLIPFRLAIAGGNIPLLFSPLPATGGVCTPGTDTFTAEAGGAGAGGPAMTSSSTCPEVNGSAGKIIFSY
jgi:hypothetical protein